MSRDSSDTLLPPVSNGAPRTDDENKLVSCAEDGERCEDSGGQPKIIRASVLEALLTGRRWDGEKTAWLIHPRGLRIRNAIVWGPHFDLEGATLIRKAWFENVIFLNHRPEMTEGFSVREEDLARIVLREAEGVTIAFMNCCAKRLNAERLHLSHNLYLDRSYFSHGVNLRYSAIDGKLSFISGKAGVHGEDLWPDDPVDHHSLNCRHSRLGGSVYLKNPDTPPEPDPDSALSSHMLRLKEEFLCKWKAARAAAGSEGSPEDDELNNFHALGKVDFRRGRIDGRFDLRHARIVHAEKMEPDDRGKRVALHCDGLEVTASIMIGDGYAAVGETNLVRSDVKADVNCAGGVFEAGTPGPSQERDSTVALNLSEAKVGAGLFLDSDHVLTRTNGRTRIAGRLILADAACRTYCDAKSEDAGIGGLAIPEGNRMVLDGFVYQELGTSCPRDWRTREKWLCRQERKYVFDRVCQQPWTQLIRVLRDMGYNKDANELGMRRERAIGKSRRWYSPGKWQSLFLAVTVGHGYKPFRPLLWAFFFFIPGFLMFTIAAEKGWMAPRSVEVLLSTEYWNREECRVPFGYRPLDPFYYTLDLLTPILEPHHEQDWAPAARPRECARTNAPLRRFFNDRSQLHGMAHTYDRAAEWSYSKFLKAGFEVGLLDVWRWFTVLIGWVLIPLFIAGVSGVMRRERFST